MINLPGWFYTTAWIAWGVWFFVVEGLALIDADRDDTLTEHVRPIVQATSFGWFLAAGLLAWLIWHFLVENAS